MNIRITDHAREQAERRGLDLNEVLEIASSPQQIVPVREGREVRQSRSRDGRHLVRLIVDVTADEVSVVTMYRTSKIEKYWRP